MSLSLYEIQVSGCPALKDSGLPFRMRFTDVMETGALPAPVLQGRMDSLDAPPSYRVSQSISRMNLAGVNRAVGNDGSALRAGRYQEAEARLIQSFRQCRNEPSAYQLKVRALERALLLLSQLAQESGDQARRLTAITADRAAIADLEPDSYRSILFQRWRAEKRQDSILDTMKITKHAVASLSQDSPPTFITPVAELAPLPAGGRHEDGQILNLEDSNATNLVTFLCCSQRVVSLRSRSRSPFLSLDLRPFTLGTASTISPSTQTSPTTTPVAMQTRMSNSGSSLNMHVKAPLTAVSLAGFAEVEPQTVGEESGTAIILTPELPPVQPLDPSSVQVDLPNYVHDLLADFDASESIPPTASSTIQSQSSDCASSNRAAASSPFFSPLQYLRKGRGPRNVKSHPNLHSKSSLKRLSDVFSVSEVLTLGKVDPKQDAVSRTALMTISESEFRGDSHPQAHNRTLSSNVIGKVMSKVGRRISFVSSKH